MATKKNKPTVTAEKATVKRPRAPYALEMPDFLYEPECEYENPIQNPESEEDVGTVLLEIPEGKKRKAPVSYTRRDFPENKEGETAFWDYKIAVCQYRKMRALTRTDPLRRDKDNLSKMMAAIVLLKAKIADTESEGSDATEE